MSLQVLSRAANTSLVELVTVKTMLGLASEEHDVLLTTILIPAASAAICRELTFDLARQRYREGFAGRGRQTLTLSCRPVDRDSVSVTIDDAEVSDWTFRPTGDLWRQSRWGRGGCEEETSEVTYTGGYLLPGDVATFEASHAYAFGAWVRPTSPRLSPWLFQVASSGSSGATEPTWPAESGDTVVSGTATFAARDAQELMTAHADVSLIAAAVAKDLFSKRDIPTGLSGRQMEGAQETYFASAFAGTLLPEWAQAHLASMRWD